MALLGVFVRSLIFLPILWLTRGRLTRGRSFCPSEAKLRSGFVPRSSHIRNTGETMPARAKTRPALSQPLISHLACTRLQKIAEARFTKTPRLIERIRGYNGKI